MSNHSGIHAKLRDHFAPTTEAELAKLEKHIGHSLPNDYRDFLLKTNGGVFHDYVVIGDAGVKDVSAVNAGQEWADLKWNFDVTRDWIPSNLLPVASAPGGDVFAMKLDMPDAGRIYFLYHDMENDFGDLPTVAQSFTDFLNGIILDPEAMEEDKSDDPAFDLIDRDDIAGLRQQLDNGLNVDHRGELNKTLLMHAAWKCRLEIMKLLIERGASIDAADDDGHRPIFFAVFTHSPDALKMIVSHGGNPGDFNSDGQSVLMRAVDNPSYRCVEELLRLGADVNYKSPDGETALSVCWEEDVKPLLLQAGAK
ncbi:SMI1/KNR4 family protein [Rhodopirellula sp. P2]|uniref:SMI1/KNR4 family protein n=1 Tax=Rhodopirellula sp. P2 TaxID=2127060 RepID=UPI002368537C|nr:SMI1/KNR4 family protein [Rhodopirellula sp. P2]WDQ16158.1 SMI1/KNR4 family protein [Rhodopirellula sp. P2]